MVNLLSAIFMQYLNLTFSFIYMYTPIKAPKITFLCYSYCKARFWIELQVEQCVNLNMNRTSSASFIVFFFFFPFTNRMTVLLIAYVQSSSKFWTSFCTMEPVQKINTRVCYHSRQAVECCKCGERTNCCCMLFSVYR